MKCTKCGDTGWVCENHPEKQFDKCCGGAGMPCTCDQDNVFDEIYASTDEDDVISVKKEIIQ